MNYSKEYISTFAKDTGFIGSNLEKVIRLLDVLKLVFSESAFKDKLLLKGGTAINLVHTNLNRLSVDIDLDYFGSLDKDITFKDRDLLEKELDIYMSDNDYDISPNSRSSFALFSRIYRYRNVFGNIDTIKVDINFMDRAHLYPHNIVTVHYFGKDVRLVTPAIEELFGMKINALIDRSKPRDLFDSAFLINHMNLFNQDMLRKAVIFYLSLNNNFKIDSTSFNKIEIINYKSVKTELLPVLKKGEMFDLTKSQNEVIDLLKKILVLTEKERAYLDEFSKGNYNPSLLFDEPIASNIKEHPMAKWRITNINKQR